MKNKIKLLLLPLGLLALASCNLNIKNRTSDNKSTTIATSTPTTNITTIATSTPTSIPSISTTTTIENKILSMELDFTKYNKIGDLNNDQNISNIINNNLIDIINTNGNYSTSFNNSILNLERSGNLRFIAHEGIYFKKITIYYGDSNNLSLYIDNESMTSYGFSEYSFSDNIDEFYLVVPSKKNSLASIKNITIEYEGNTNNDIQMNKVDFDNTYYLDALNGKLSKSYVLPSLSTDNNNPKILVVPVSLDNSKEKYHDEYLKNINIAFNGDNITTGFESVKSYYYKASGGLCNLDITVVDKWYSDSKYTVNTLANLYRNYAYGYLSYDPVEQMGQEILKAYDSEIDYTQFDSNNDGAIDAVWFIYDCDVVTSSSSSPYWAYTVNTVLPFDDYGNIKNNYKYDGKFMSFYAFAGVGFMEPGAFSSYNSDNIIVDSHTYIHETGHLFGLDDYYDYNSEVGCNRGLYGASMMDYNIGDLDPYSKLLLNWIDPYVISGEGEITFILDSFEKTNSVIIIADHRLTNIYDTYYMIEYYTNTDLNENDKPINGNGIRILKINSQINYNDDFESAYYSSNYYSSPFRYNNTDTSIPQIEMIYNGTIKSKYTGSYSLDSSNLFTNEQEYENSLFKLYVGNITENISAELKITKGEQE